MCLFCDIASGKIPSKKVYEDEFVVAFEDISPQAPIHLLIIPRKHIESVQTMLPEDDMLLARLFSIARTLAHETGVDRTGYRLITNVGSDGGQSVLHLHLHLIGGKPLLWNNG